jgi:fructuronate reductase
VNVHTQTPLPLDASSLVRAKSGIRRPAYDRDAVDIGIVHIGPGAFHRAHQACFVDDLLQHDPRWGISGVSLRTAGVRDALAPQDNLYTLAILDEQTEFRVIGSLKEMLVAPESPERVLRRLCSPQTQVVTITVTEKGYCLDGRGELDIGHPDIVHDRAHHHAPLSLVGYLTEALRRRRADGTKPFTVISCDNLADNGLRLRNAVLQFAGDVDRDLSGWIEAEVTFPRTMVDSITPATDDALRSRVTEATGLLDRWPVQREAFAQWVIEALPGAGPDWESVGAIVTSNVSAYERAKLRLLNGAHSSLAYLGLLRNYETVAEAMQDRTLADFVSTLMLQDIAPTLRPPQGFDIPAYVEAILKRFRNPAIRHNLAQIACDGSQKLPIRLLGSITESIINGRSIERLCLPVAAWMLFVRRQSARGLRLVDPLADVLAKAAHAGHSDPADAVDEFLKIRTMFPEALAANGRFRERVTASYARLALA